jgi:predicted Zn-dependent peptidase
MYAGENDFDNITSEDLSAFYNKHYVPSNCKLIISGKVGEKEINIINAHFGKDNWNKPSLVKTPSFKIAAKPKPEYILKKEDAVQSSFRIGRRLFTKSHPDYVGMTILNTVLGGYFGSRLMSNIREDKGYTYGIGSVVAPYKNDGCFVIITEVGAEVTRPAIKEVFSELKLLREKLIPEHELSVVKNYMLGDILRSMDGAFALSDVIKDMIENSLDYSFYAKVITQLKTISASELRDLANKYFQEKDMITVIAGKVL